MALATAALAWAAIIPTIANADAIALTNPSFESPFIPTPPNPEEFNQEEIAAPFLTGWTETGPITNFGEFSGMLATGVFLNIPLVVEPATETTPAVVIPAIPNATDRQVAFMQIVANPDPEEIVSVSQETAENFAPDLSYQFSLDIGASITIGVNGTPENPALIELHIGYFDIADDFQSVAMNEDPIGADDLEVLLLKTFSVTTPILDVSDPAIGQPIAVLIRQTGGTGGAFNFDNAQLFNSIPEPTSAILFATTMALTIHRRRHA